jgi:hypothetical protein
MEDEEIRSALRSQGWTEQEIADSFAEAAANRARLSDSRPHRRTAADVRAGLPQMRGRPTIDDEPRAASVTFRVTLAHRGRWRTHASAVGRRVSLTQWGIDRLEEACDLEDHSTQAQRARWAYAASREEKNLGAFIAEALEYVCDQLGVPSAAQTPPWWKTTPGAAGSGPSGALAQEARTGNGAKTSRGGVAPPQPDGEDGADPTG